MRTAVFIDGSNLLGALGRAGLGYPALTPFLQQLIGSNELVFARFYAAPPSDEPYKGHFLSMQQANRHIEHLEFFQGYRKVSGQEKCIDVAIGVDLCMGAALGQFDFAHIVTGDGDLLYAIKQAHEVLKNNLRVHLMPKQYLSALGPVKINFTRWSVEQILEIGMALSGATTPVPKSYRASEGEPWKAKIVTGAFATEAQQRDSSG